MKLNEKYYSEIVLEKIGDYYDKEKHGSMKKFIKTVEKSVKETIKFYEENFDIDDDDDFDIEIFESDLISDAKKAIL